MATGVQSWSKTAATNASADSAVNFAEGQAPSSVNDSARGLMASVAKWRDDTNGTIETGGSSTAYTATSNQGFASESAMDGACLTLKFNATSGAAPTLAVDSLTARAIQVASGAAVPTGFFLSGSIYRLTFVNAIPAWLVHGIPAVLPDGTALPDDSVDTDVIADESVTNTKLADMAEGTLKGRASSGSGVPEDITIGTGLLLNSTTLTAPAFPPSAAFKNLVIKVTGNTGVDVDADFVVTTDGTNYQTTAVNSSINLGSNGAADRLDTGSIAQATWYAIWVIAKEDGTTACLASTSASSPTMPSDYTFKARVGWVRTAAGSAQLLGTWQFGRRAQYKNGLAQSSALPLITTPGVHGTFSTSSPAWDNVSVSSVVPSTASEITINWTNVYNGNAQRALQVAPSDSYGGHAVANPPPLSILSTSDAQAGSLTFMLEGTTISHTSTGDGGAIFCSGWVDNI